VCVSVGFIHCHRGEADVKDFGCRSFERSCQCVTPRINGKKRVFARFAQAHNKDN